MPLVEDNQCDLVFYTNPWSRGQVVRWMLEETGVAYRQVVLNYGEQMKTPAYLAINPMGKVPTLVHEGKVVTECPAICAYLADTFPEAALAPPFYDRAAYYRWLFFAAGPLEAAIVNRLLKVEVNDEQQAMVGYGNYDKAVDVLAKVVSASSYLAGNRFSAADVYVGSHVIWGLQFNSLPKRPEFEDYAKRLMDRPAFIKAKAIDDALGDTIKAAAQD
ncbi:glutathione S-transferase family protein [Bowmanella yangjiangensis]|uniref:Glutathione S-transferase family protein n=1 Tax=Bowmanella yangjiangensis TaxID=2811230 RepID=A0ABS3CPN4_9ALTE|nr:glutathione S-transferase family protein [Bowmanella yangjiangensis]MBN7819051.1 glutathione S-transferase family protein [Bowmanella yangjiangensis]